MKRYLPNFHNYSIRNAFADKYYSLGLTICLIQGMGLGPKNFQWGLDPSWGWLSVKAEQLGWYAQGKYLWTYGPTFFLDTQSIGWAQGFALASIFRVAVGTFFFTTIYKLCDKKKCTKIWTLSISIIFTTVSFILFTPSLILIATLWVILLSDLVQCRFASAFNIFLLSLISVVELFDKILQGLIAVLLSIALINRQKLAIKASGFYLSLSALIVGLFLYFSGFTSKSLDLYLRGQYELTIGYKAMASEAVGGLWEYLAVIILSILAVWSLRIQSRHIFKITIFVTIDILLIQYGFIRHDAHSQTTFYFLMLALIASTDINFSSASCFPAYLAIGTFLVVTSISISAIIDFSPRLQSFSSDFKLMDPRYKQQLIEQDIATLQGNAHVNSNMLAKIGKQTVAVMPWDQLVGRAYNLNLVSTPIPQNYSAYTNWLDETNAYYLQGMSAPEYILVSAPEAIDGRNPKWESPLAQVALICSYKSINYDSDWLLLQKREQSICNITGEGNNNSVSSASQNGILVANVTQHTSFMQRTVSMIFKRTHYETIMENDLTWNLVSANHQNLIINVPKYIDFPAKWAFGQKNILTASANQEIHYSVIPLN